MESGTPPIKNYLLGARYQYAGKTAQYQAQSVIQRAVDKIKSQNQWKRRKDRAHHIPQKAKDLQEFQRLSTIIALQKKTQDNQPSKEKKKQSLAEQMAGILWEQDWKRNPARPGTPKGLQEFGKHNYQLYMDLKRAEASIAIQIRSKYIRLRAYLYRRKVLDIVDLECLYSY